MSMPVIEESELKILEHTPTVDELAQMFPFEEPTDSNARAHIINPPMNLHIWRLGMTVQEIVDVARMTGQQLTALCGHIMIPKHDPDKCDICEKCLKVAADLLSDSGE